MTPSSTVTLEPAGRDASTSRRAAIDWSGDSGGPDRRQSGGASAGGSAGASRSSTRPAATRSRTTPGAAPGEPGELGGRQRRPVAQRSEHPPARRWSAAFRAAVSASAASPAGRQPHRAAAAAAAAAPRGRSSPCAAPSRAAPSCRRRRARQSGAARAAAPAPAISRATGFSRSTGSSSLRPVPDHPDEAARAERHAHEAAGLGWRRLLRDQVVERLGQRQRQQARGLRRTFARRAARLRRQADRRNWHDRRASAKLASRYSARQASFDERTRRFETGLGWFPYDRVPLCQPVFPPSAPSARRAGSRRGRPSARPAKADPRRRPAAAAAERDRRPRRHRLSARASRFSRPASRSVYGWCGRRRARPATVCSISSISCSSGCVTIWCGWRTSRRA